jgi:hypothetical protein
VLLASEIASNIDNNAEVEV